MKPTGKENDERETVSYGKWINNIVTMFPCSPVLEGSLYLLGVTIGPIDSRAKIAHAAYYAN